MVTWSRLGFLFALAQTLKFIVWSFWHQALIRRPFAWYCSPWLSENCYIEVGETYICGHVGYFNAILQFCSPNPWVLFSGLEVSCWMTPSPWPVLFGGKAFSWPEFLVVLSSASCCWVEYILYKVYSNSNHCLFSELPSASTRVLHSWAAAAAHPL